MNNIVNIIGRMNDRRANENKRSGDSFCVYDINTI